MAEEHPADPSALLHEEGTEAHAAETAGDPASHAADYALFGIDSQGRFLAKSEMYDKHGQALAGYRPGYLGPFKLEYTRNMLDMTVVAALLAIVLVTIARRVMRDVRTDRAPHGRLANAVEAMLVFVRNDVVAPIGGHHLLPFAPLFLTYFFFILAMNLSGLVPVLFKGPTANLWINMTLAASVMVFLFGAGMVKQGPVGFLKNIVPSGIPWWLWPFMFVLEFAGTILRCSVLGIRLFANMVAGHLAIPSILALGTFKGGAVTGMAVVGLIIGIPLALGMTLLEVLVALIQAYVFTMLAVIFSGAAVHPEH